MQPFPNDKFASTCGALSPVGSMHRTLSPTQIQILAILHLKVKILLHTSSSILRFETKIFDIFTATVNAKSRLSGTIHRHNKMIAVDASSAEKFVRVVSLATRRHNSKRGSSILK